MSADQRRRNDRWVPDIMIVEHHFLRRYWLEAGTCDQLEVSSRYNLLDNHGGSGAPCALGVPFAGVEGRTACGLTQ